ncbi:putative transcriptional regulator [Lachnospiraceae bacterium TWA4]|nr:putative transcriptional regulator [Lachnospiraceae bacterium TWA4]
MTYEEFFPQRLSFLRMKLGVSARDMSLSIGQNPGYINTIENGKAFPTMNNFFAICDYLHVSPTDFFDNNIEYPKQFEMIIERLPDLSEHQLNLIYGIIREFSKHSKK